MAEFERVADVSALDDTNRLHLKLRNRYVSIIRYQDNIFCLDSTCYHAGGPLGLGDIEDINGDPCIVCPWHFYKITLNRGGKLYQPLIMNAEKKLIPGVWKVKG